MFLKIGSGNLSKRAISANKNHKHSQNRIMLFISSTYVATKIALLMILELFMVPIYFSIRFHFSLEKQSLFATVKIFGLDLFKINFTKFRQKFRAFGKWTYIDSSGKKNRVAGGKVDIVPYVLKVVKNLRIEKVVLFSRIGTRSSHHTAMAYLMVDSLASLMSSHLKQCHCQTIPDWTDDTLVVDAEIELSLKPFALWRK